ncbi:MAG TPA: uracil-DNA glycosylase [Chroococcales cyanobacterium]
MNSNEAIALEEVRLFCLPNIRPERISDINQFVDDLARVESPSNACNQYSYEATANSIRRHNLLLYLQQMAALNPQILLVGEAPGYRGCRLTGVPFTSEFILVNGLEKLGLFGQARGYRISEKSEKLSREASASMVWETLETTQVIPLIWNAFPFHPFQTNNERSNRKPKGTELLIGQDFLQRLIQLFDIKRVVAVGNTAASSLKRQGIDYQKVRHPSHGGKTQFTIGIREAIALCRKNP